MKGLNLERIGKFAGQVCELVAYGVLIAASQKVAEYVTIENSDSNAGYDDAVEAIMDSSMFSHDKREAVAALSRYGDAKFYRAIVHIAKDSSMFSHDKADMIRDLCKK